MHEGDSFETRAVCASDWNICGCKIVHRSEADGGGAGGRQPPSGDQAQTLQHNVNVTKVK